MPEVEIKLQIPLARWAAVRREFERGKSATARFLTICFDTPDRRLAAAGVVLRLRRAGGRWIQGVKGQGDGLLRRLEHEVVRGRARAMPTLDLSLHDGTDEGRALVAALGQASGALEPVHIVDVRRAVRLVRHERSIVELALDSGHLRAGAHGERICELEFELKSGHVPDLVSLAARWVARHGLWLDVRTKAELGLRLAGGGVAGPAARFMPPVLAPEDPPDRMLRAGVAAALAQVLSQGAEIAAGRATADHVHQARVGLRRLLSLLREFGDWSPDVDVDWAPRLHALFAELGHARDRDVLGGWILAQMQAAGAPSLDLGAAADGPDLSARWRSPSVTALMLELLAFAYGEPAAAIDTTAVAGSALDRARPALERLHRRVRRAGRRFAALDDAARHRARKQLKRLRYVAESLSSQFPARAWADYVARLKRAQDAVGRFQDLTVAEVAWRARVAQDPTAWFALGWLAARRDGCIDEAGRALVSLGKMPRFLR